MKIEKLWVVCDPSEDSTLDDILYATDALGLAELAIGTGAAAWKREHTTLYTEEREARRDAEGRLARQPSPEPSKGDLYTYDRNGRKVRVTIPGR